MQKQVFTSRQTKTLESVSFNLTPKAKALCSSESKMLLFLAAVLAAIILYLVKYHYSYWARMGFPFVAPLIPAGCLGPVVVQK